MQHGQQEDARFGKQLFASIFHKHMTMKAILHVMPEPVLLLDCAAFIQRSICSMYFTDTFVYTTCLLLS